MPLPFSWEFIIHCHGLVMPRILFYKLTRLCLIVSVLLLQWNLSSATTITAIADGSWSSGSTWSLGRKPTCGDTVIIPVNRIVTVNAQENLVPCGAAVIVYVSGTFQFTNGNKIDFPCGSWVYINNGGLVKKATAGGGSSTLISICGYIEWKAGDGPISGPDTLGGHGSLPVSWLSMQASVKGKKIEFSWSTASEINNAYFIIERSNDGINYKWVGKMKGNGNSTSVSYYSFDDAEPANGINYYRLVQVDFDGTENPSSVVAAYFSGGLAIDDVKLSPNPVANEAVIVFDAIADNQTTIEIKNISGQICWSQMVTSVKGTNTFAMDNISKLTKGIYTLTVSTVAGSSKSIGLIKK